MNARTLAIAVRGLATSSTRHDSSSRGESGALRRDDDAAVSGGESLANSGRHLMMDEIETPILRSV